jgi:type III restriction enzyme
VEASVAADDLRRRILLTLNMNRVVQHIWEAIRFENTLQLEPVFDTERPILSTADMRPWYTSRPCEVTQKSHLNVAVYDSRWAATEAFELDRNELVNAWVKNNHLGFEILYVYHGVVKKYRPDFLIRLRNGTLLVLEVKGDPTDEARAKQRFLEEWVHAENAYGGFGRWAWAVSRKTADLPGILEKT